MISKETIAALEEEERGWQYILGARMRSQNEVKDDVLSRGGRYRVVHPRASKSDDPSPLKVKEVCVDKRRYIVCLNDDEARKDAADREAIVAALREQLRSGDKSLVGNKGYRRYLTGGGPDHFQVDEAKIAEDAALRRQMGAPHQHRVGFRRSGIAVQAALDGGALVPLVQVALADPPDLPQVRRNDPWPCVLLVPGVGAPPGIAVSPGGARAQIRVGRCDRGFGSFASRWRWSRTASGSC